MGIAPSAALPRAARAAGRVLVLGSRRNEATASLVDAWGVELCSPERAIATVTPADTVLGRLDVLPTLDGVEPGLLALLACERRGADVLNPVAALLAAHDKLRTARLLAAAGVPHPRVALVRRRGDLPERAGPLVVKPRFGSWGRHVFWCDSRAELDDVLDAVQDTPWFLRHGALVQEAVPPLGHDVRIVVAGGRVVGAVERVAAPGEWRTNVSLGGAFRRFEPDGDLCELARTAAAVIGADLVGVDLLPLEGGGHVVLELNGAVDFDATAARAGHDVFADAGAALGLDV